MDEKRPQSKVKIIAQTLKEYGQPNKDNFANPLLLYKGALRERTRSAQQVAELKDQISHLQKDLGEKPESAATQLKQQIQALQLKLATAEGELKAKSEEITRKDQTISAAITTPKIQVNLKK